MRLIGWLLVVSSTAAAATPAAEREADRLLESRPLQLAAAVAERSDRDALLLQAMLRPLQRRAAAHTGPFDDETLAAHALAGTADAHLLYRLVQSDALQLQQPQRNALYERLVALDGDNLAVHMLALPDVEPAGFDRWTEAAARSRRNHAYFGDSVVVLADALAAVPADAQQLAAMGAMLGSPVADAAPGDTAMAVGLVMAVASPAAQPLFSHCDRQRAIDWHPARQRDCLQIARVLATSSDTLMDRSLGLALWHRLAEGSAAATGVEAMRRATQWQIAASLELALEAGDAETGRQRLEFLRAGLTELEAVTAELQAAGIALTPPERWQPAAPAGEPGN